MPGGPDDPYSPPGGGAPGPDFGDPGPDDTPDPGPGGPGPGGSAPSDPGPADPGPSAPGPVAAAPDLPFSPDTPDEAIPDVAINRPASFELNEDRGGKSENEPSSFGVSTMSTPATGTVTDQKTAKEEAKEFAQSLECASACKAKVTSNGDVTVTVSAKAKTGEDVDVTVKQQGNTVKASVTIGDTTTSAGSATYSSKKEAQAVTKHVVSTAAPLASAQTASLISGAIGRAISGGTGGGFSPSSF